MVKNISPSHFQFRGLWMVLPVWLEETSSRAWNLGTVTRVVVLQASLVEKPTELSPRTKVPYIVWLDSSPVTMQAELHEGPAGLRPRRPLPVEDNWMNILETYYGWLVALTRTPTWSPASAKHEASYPAMATPKKMYLKVWASSVPRTPSFTLLGCIALSLICLRENLTRQTTASEPKRASFIQAIFP